MAKFKVGDRVRSRGARDAGVGIVEEVLDGGIYVVNFRDTWYKRCHEKERSLELVEEKKPLTFTVGRLFAGDVFGSGLQIAGLKPAIVCLMQNGQPLPSEKPHVHATVAAAEKEAGRLAGVYKGKEFAVFEMGATRREEPTYSHEWQRLAATGDRLGAIKSLRQLGGMSLTSALVAVQHFLDAA